MIVNSRALRLDRNGFELLTWIGPGSNYKSIGGDLDLMCRSLTFEPGARYSDFTPNEKVAAYSIAGLVATLAGAKLVKVAAAGGLLLLLKKFGVLLVVAVGAGFAKLRALLRRKRSTPTIGGDAA